MRSLVVLLKKRRIYSGIAIFFLVLVLYKPVAGFYENRSRCNEIKTQTKFLSSAYDELEQSSKRMALLVDIYRLSPNSMPADAKMEAADYAALHQSISNAYINIGYKFAQNMEKYLTPENLLPNIFEKISKRYERCKSQFPSFSKACAHLEVLNLKMSINLREWKSCKSDLWDKETSRMGKLLSNTRHMRISAEKIQNMTTAD
jgi:hypothetical protein